MNKKTVLALIGFFLVLAGLLLISYDYFKSKKDKAFELLNTELFKLQERDDEGDYENDDLEDLEVEKIDPKPNNDTEPSYPVYYYIGMLEIPKIGLSKGFVDPNSPSNNIDENITIIKPSSFPNVDQGNFILAAHSGTGYISFFKHLYLLSKGDLAYIYYQNVKYTYQIVDIYTAPKIGSVPIYRNYKETVLTLITCTKNDESTQTIYIANLIDKNTY